mmetsp:Transcript_24300/g.72591  ORF Transcript_24300/g.72591 Transcript_24300/m.72591 type:complete len:245 (-) Transcript_24300:1792-2526(-)
MLTSPLTSSTFIARSVACETLTEAVNRFGESNCARLHLVAYTNSTVHSKPCRASDSNRTIPSFAPFSSTVNSIDDGLTSSGPIKSAASLGAAIGAPGLLVLARKRTWIALDAARFTGSLKAMLTTSHCDFAFAELTVDSATYLTPVARNLSSYVTVPPTGTLKGKICSPKSPEAHALPVVSTATPKFLPIERALTDPAVGQKASIANSVGSRSLKSLISFLMHGPHTSQSHPSTHRKRPAACDG